MKKNQLIFPASFISASIIIVLLFFSSGTSAQKSYHQFLKRKQVTITPPWTFTFNTGVFFVEMPGSDHTIYKQKDYNPAYGFSIGRRLVRNISLRGDLAKGKLSANNFKSTPALTDQVYSYYRDFTTDINYS